MEKNESADILNDNYMSGTEANITDKNTGDIIATQDDNSKVISEGPISTVSNTVIYMDSLADTLTNEPINCNKPWRYVIRRRIADGGNDYEN